VAFLRGIRERLRALLRHGELEAEMEEELQFHLEAAIERNIERGMNVDEARTAALRDFGGMERRKQQVRDERGVRLFINTGQNLKYALRHLLTNPGFTLVAVLVMGLGIGANTAIFSVVNSLLIQSIPCGDPDTLIRIYSVIPESGEPEWNSYPDFLDYGARTTVFSGMAAEGDIQLLSLLTDTGAESVMSAYYSANFFEVMQVSPLLGRSFLPEEDVPGATPPVAIVSYEAWHRRHGSDPAIVGQTIRLNGHPVTVVGVGPKDFNGGFLGFMVDYWLPWGSADRVDPGHHWSEQRDIREYNIFGRLRPGTTLEQARTELEVITVALAEEYPETNAGRGIALYRMNEIRLDPRMDRVLAPISGFLMIVVLLVLLVACSNLAGFLLLQASARQKEIAVRLSMGAGRGRLIGQLLTESILLAVLGGLFGIAVAFGMAGAVVSTRLPLPVPTSFDFAIDSTVLLFTLALSIATGLIFGLTPALKASKPNLVAVLRDSAASHTAGRERFTSRNLFIVAQVTVSLVLLVGAGLFMRSFGLRRRADLGFDTERLAIAVLDASLGGHLEEAAGRTFLDSYLVRVRALPEVTGAAWTSRIPFGLWNAGDHAPVRGEGLESAPGPGSGAGTGVEEPEDVGYSIVSETFFSTLGLELLHGRTFSERDSRSAPAVTVVSEALARQIWGIPDPVGRRLLAGEFAETRSLEVVGVVADMCNFSMDPERPEPWFYLPATQHYEPMTTLVARTDGDPGLLSSRLRAELRAINENITLFDARTMSDHLRITFFIDQTAATFLTLFGALALGLSMIGLFGLISFSMNLRVREFGIRMALGADRVAVIGMVLKQGLKLVTIGLVLGLVISALVMQILEKALYGISAFDPVTIVGVVVLFLTVAALASWIPARRAVVLDPMKSLRYE